MSTDAWIEEHWIGEAVLPRPRRAPKLPALPVPHAPTCSRGNAALAVHAQSRDSARHPGDRLSARQDGRNGVDQQARKLTQPMAAEKADPGSGQPKSAGRMRMRRRGDRHQFGDALYDAQHCHLRIAERDEPRVDSVGTTTTHAITSPLKF